MQKNDEQNQPQVAINVNLDTTPILYTDSIYMNVNSYGLVLDATQKIGNQTRIVSRIGMSREHAKQFVIELGKLLAMTEGQVKSNQKKTIS